MAASYTQVTAALSLAFKQRKPCRALTRQAIWRLIRDNRLKERTTPRCARSKRGITSFCWAFPRYNRVSTTICTMVWWVSGITTRVAPLLRRLNRTVIKSQFQMDSRWTSPASTKTLASKAELSIHILTLPTLTSSRALFSYITLLSWRYRQVRSLFTVGRLRL